MSLVNAALHSLGIDPGTDGPLGGKKIKNVLLERLPETTCLLANQLLNYKKSRAPPRPDFYSRRPPRTDPRKLRGSVRGFVRVSTHEQTPGRTQKRTHKWTHERTHKWTHERKQEQTHKRKFWKLYKSSPTNKF